MGFAKHVGRVGALAVALGVGAAVASTPGVAWADGETDNPAVSGGLDKEKPESDDASTPSSGKPDPGAVIRKSIERAADDLRDGIRKVVSGVARSSGGAITSSRRNGSDSTKGNVLPDVDEVEHERTVDVDAPKSGPRTFDIANSSAPHVFTPRWQPPQALIGSKPAPKPVVKVLDDVKDVVQQSVNTVTGNQPPSGSPNAQRNAITTLDAPPSVEDAPAVRPRLVAPVAIMTNVLNAAIAPFLNPTPGQPAPQNPVLWGVLGWVRRQVQDSPFGKVVLNRTPRVDVETTQVVDNGDGTFTITPAGSDPDGDDLTFTVSGSDAGEGTLTDNHDGTFTYEVTDPDWDESDTITITVSDAADYPHLHGLASLFNFNGAHTNSVTIDIRPSGSLPPPVVVPGKDLQPLGDGSGNWVAEFQYDDTVSDVQAAFDPKYWRVVDQTFDNGVYRVVLEPTELGKLRAGLKLSTNDELLLQVVKYPTVQTMALRSAQVASLDVDPPEQAYQLPTPPAAHYVTNPDIPVGNSPAGVVVTKYYAYVANEQDGTVTVIDVNPSDDDPLNPTFNKVIDTITVGSQPFFAGMSGDRLYVVGADSVSIVSTTTNQAVDTISVAPKFLFISIPTNALVSPDGKKLYLLNANDGYVYAIDIGDPTSPEYKSITPISVGSGFTTEGTLSIDFPISGGFSADGTRLYVVRESIETDDAIHFTFHDGELVVIDTATDEVIPGSVDIGQFGAYAASDGRYLYIPTYDSAELSAAYPEGSPRGYVTVVDISSDPDQPAVVARLDAGALPLNVVMSPDQSLAYVVNAGDGTITVIDTVNNVVLDMDPSTTAVDGIRFTDTPAEDIFIKNVIGINPDGTRLYVTNYTTNTVTALEIVDGLASQTV